ncbi:unnamed protein product [Amoebophrya sp. A25]|nr:unnamed protein product [Amoebophrya sp. A25]|eukprot:GSA25T00017986001.1
MGTSPGGDGEVSGGSAMSKNDTSSMIEAVLQREDAIRQLLLHEAGTTTLRFLEGSLLGDDRRGGDYAGSSSVVSDTSSSAKALPCCHDWREAGGTETTSTAATTSAVAVDGVGKASATTRSTSSTSRSSTSASTGSSRPPSTRSYFWNRRTNETSWSAIRGAPRELPLPDGWRQDFAVVSRGHALEDELAGDRDLAVVDQVVHDAGSRDVLASSSISSSRFLAKRPLYVLHDSCWQRERPFALEQGWRYHWDAVQKAVFYERIASIEHPAPLAEIRNSTGSSPAWNSTTTGTTGLPSDHTTSTDSQHIVLPATSRTSSSSKSSSTSNSSSTSTTISTSLSSSTSTSTTLLSSSTSTSASSSGRRRCHPWRSAVDAKTGKNYYWRPGTKETQWESPVRAAPDSTPLPEGWTTQIRTANGVVSSAGGDTGSTSSSATGSTTSRGGTSTSSSSSPSSSTKHTGTSSPSANSASSSTSSYNFYVLRDLCWQMERPLPLLESWTYQFDAATRKLFYQQKARRLFPAPVADLGIGGGTSSATTSSSPELLEDAAAMTAIREELEREAFLRHEEHEKTLEKFSSSSRSVFDEDTTTGVNNSVKNSTMLAPIIEEGTSQNKQKSDTESSTSFAAIGVVVASLLVLFSFLFYKNRWKNCGSGTTSGATPPSSSSIVRTCKQKEGESSESSSSNVSPPSSTKKTRKETSVDPSEDTENDGEIYRPSSRASPSANNDNIKVSSLSSTSTSSSTTGEDAVEALPALLEAVPAATSERVDAPLATFEDGPVAFSERQTVEIAEKTYAPSASPSLEEPERQVLHLPPTDEHRLSDDEGSFGNSRGRTSSFSSTRDRRNSRSPPPRRPTRSRQTEEERQAERECIQFYSMSPISTSEDEKMRNEYYPSEDPYTALELVREKMLRDKPAPRILSVLHESEEEHAAEEAHFPTSGTVAEPNRVAPKPRNKRRITMA